MVISGRKANPRGEAGVPRARAHAAAYGESLVEASNRWFRERAVLGGCQAVKRRSGCDTKLQTICPTTALDRDPGQPGSE